MYHLHSVMQVFLNKIKTFLIVIIKIKNEVFTNIELNDNPGNNCR